MDEDLSGLPLNLHHLEGCPHTTDMQVFAALSWTSIIFVKKVNILKENS